MSRQITFSNGKLHLRLWSVERSGWIWFDRANLRRFDFGTKDRGCTIWWAVLGFSGMVTWRIRRP